MRLNKGMIQAFTNIVRGSNSIEKLAFVLKKSYNRTVEIVQDLEKEGFVIKINNYNLTGSRKIIDLASTSHAIKLKDLIFEYSTVRFEDLLSDSKLLFLVALSDDWINIDMVSELTQVSKYMISRYTSMMKNRGLIIQENKLYKINEKAWALLVEFLKAYKNYAIIKGHVKWKYQEYILFEVDDNSLIQGSLTGFVRYEDYGIKIHTIKSLCLLPEKKLTKEEIFIHSMFEINDPRTLHLALVFYIKNNLKYKKVILLAMKYGKYTIFNNFIQLLKVKEGKIKIDTLPVFDRKDFIRIADLYGVKNV